MENLPELHVEVRFGKGVPVEYHGPAMMAFERYLREHSKLNVEVFKPARGDDSRLRSLMTVEQRAKL